MPYIPSHIPRILAEERVRLALVRIERMVAAPGLTHRSFWSSLSPILILHAILVRPRFVNPRVRGRRP